MIAGSKLGPYLIVRQLGCGGMGEVFEAQDTRLDRRVALKVVRRDLASDPARRQRLEREARAAAGLNHPNIVTLHSLEEYDGVLFLTMELIAGAALSDAIPRDGMPRDQLLRLAVQLTDALAVAHEAGIIHRDIKPANIMVTRTGQLKILDFGLSKNAEPRGTALTTESLTNGGGVVGTAHYMAPEVIEGREADARADIFATGLVLFEMATGRRPFGGETALAALTAILRDAPPLASEVNPAVPDELAQLIHRCLAKEPSQRRQSASDLRADLEQLAARLRAGDSGRSSQSIARPAGPSSPSRVAAHRATVVGVAVAAVIAALAFLASRGEELAPTAPSKPIRSLAILPLADLAGDPQHQYFIDGMTEALITGLARIEGLRVVPRAAVLKYRDARRSPADIARELAVDGILDGSVARDGEKVRVSVQLIDGAANHRLWSASYERDLRDVLRLHAEVARGVASELRLDLTPRDQVRLAFGGRSVNPAAYDLYLRGITLLERMNARDAEAAAARLEEAAVLDPTFADAFGALASAYAQLYASYGPGDAARLEPQARAAISKALALDPESADALAAHGDLVWDAAHGWRHEDAIEAHRRALALRPSFVYSRHRLATVYNHIGLADLALRELSHADESPAVLMQKGLAFRIQGRDDLAVAAWRAIPPTARNTTHLGHLAWTLVDIGRADEAGEVLRQVPADAGDVNGMLAAVGALLEAMAGRPQHAAQRLRTAAAQADATRESHHATYIMALTHSRLGNRDEALRWLRFTATNGFPCYPLIARDPHLDRLRSYPPFQQFMDELRLRWEGYRRRFGSE